ncbi:fatty acid synthase-like [Camponotus floridanus]|uniref:fatty acid synthase-like n=1 Tax=Camponotus floridanus TaxID=104421 RepID=UPI000DC6769B|nr:fatty acid synthase-like [Camponotus floridanus]
MDYKKTTLLDVEEDRIVISGIAGRFPESDNIKHLQQNLYKKVDLGSNNNRRWNNVHSEIPQRTGKVNNLEKFDAEYFNIPFNEVPLIDPMGRMLLEHTYEAIVDAGINPKDLRGTNTGVFIAVCFSESEDKWIYQKHQITDSAILGISKTMSANRISYWLNTNGPSYTIDSACSSSLFAIERAYRSMQLGECDAAIVGGANLCLNPLISLQFMRLGVLSSDGFCRSFDENANGYMRSETIGIVFLQKAKKAKRIYATVVHVKTNCDGYKQQGITFPSSKIQRVLFQEFYDECGVSPSTIDFIEAHATGTKVGDPEEINAIDKVFCKDRQTPLLIGSVKSNLGHSEAAAGLCQIVKVIIAMQTGIIPPNANFTKERKGIKAFEEGKIRVVKSATPWKPSFAGINSFGFGGANCHILLQSHLKQKVNGGARNDDLPRLVIVSGRTEQAVESLLNEIDNQPIDIEYVRLLHDLHADDIQGHPYRGYAIIESKVFTTIREIHHYSGKKKPICFMFSGIGSQWPGMGQALLQFPAFYKTIEKCDIILRTRGMRIMNILTNKHEAIFNNILNSLVGVTVIQMGLIELLKSVNIVPNHVIGHSIGELCCGYVTGNFTMEQVLLSSYYIGLALNETKIIHGAMADIGLSYENAKNICPLDIDIISVKSQNTCTISGPEKSVTTFITKLQDNNIFTKKINCSNIPLHSRYLASVRATILDYLNRIIPNNMKHNLMWQSPFCETRKLSYAEYFTNNLLGSILFEETVKRENWILKNSIIVEIAPDGVFQSVMKELTDTTISIALLQRHHEDNVKVFLQGLGKMYNNGLQPQLANLYPTVQFPVSRGTPMISPLIKWNHFEDWYVAHFRTDKKITSGERTIKITLKNESFEYIIGHIIDGRNLLPATGYLLLVWDTISLLRGQWLNNISIVFENVKFLRATHIPKQGDLDLILMVQKGTGNFEIIEGGNAVVTGKARIASDPVKEKVPNHLLLENSEDEEEVMTIRDIYKELKLRGYQYANLFRGLKSTSTTGKRGHIAWTNNWVTFMDTMLQIKILGIDMRNLYVPTEIQKLVIDTKLHAQCIQNITTEEKQLPVHVYKDIETIVSGGIEIRGVKATSIFRRKTIGTPVLEEYKFVAHRDGAEVSLQDSIILSTHLALEYHQMTKVNIIELIEDGDEITTEELASPLFLEVLNNLPLIKPDINLITRTDRFASITLPSKIMISQSKKLSKDNNAILIAGFNLLINDKSEILKEILSALKDDGFLLTRGQPLTKNDITNAEKHDLTIVLEKRTIKEHIILLKKKKKSWRRTEVICVNNYEFSWLKQLISNLNIENNIARIILVGEGNPECGLLGLVNCLRKEPGGELIRAVLIQDETAPKFSLDEPFYAKQLQIDLIINVLRPGMIWGSYRHLPLAPLAPKLSYHALVNQMIRGDLNSFRWIEGPIVSGYQHENLVRIVYASINFKDVMLATARIIMDEYMSRGRLEECLIGLEYVGIDSAGRRVMGIWENRCIANMRIADRALCWYVPEEWTLEDAATVPCAYGTCYYGLYVKTRMKKGDKILIHSGTGAVGQAAIHLALHEGCEVFVTVGTLEKRKFIRETFPSIPENHIGNSRDTSFEQMIFRQTEGRGVDLVLNSLAEEKLQASIRCLAKNGRFLEIGKFDFMANNMLDLSMFSKGITFYSVMLDNLFSATEKQRMALNKVLVNGLISGAIKPISRKVFQRDEIEDAFRYMAAGKHIGKIIIKIHKEDECIDAPIPALPRYYCMANKTYIIFGGLGGFGLELADWLIIRGAENLVLVSRKGIKNGYQQMKIELWKSYGVKVLIISDMDASNVDGCEHVLRTAEKLAPVDAIFNLAVVLNDKICQNHTIETFQEPFRAKAWTTMNLDQLSRKICPQLRHFVVFSSVSCGRGNAGQTNYGMANSIMERICEKRVQEGLHGLAIQWGAIGDVGLVADMQDDDKEMIIGGTLQQKITSCIEKLEEFLLQEHPVVASMVVAEKRSDAFGASNIVETVANIMGLKDLNNVARHTPLPELGMDSMMAVEIKQTLEREFDVFLTAQDIRYLNFAKLIEMFDKDTSIDQNVRDLNELTGIKLLVRLIGNDHLIPDICVDLSTKRNNARSEIFLVPGIEGCGSIFDSLVHHIEAPATCLQHGAYNIGTGCTSVNEIADRLLKNIMSKKKLSQNFVIVGYSLGSLIAIELVRKLEEMNLQGRLVLIDGAPEQMKSISSQHLSFKTITELENNILLGIMDTIKPALSGKLLLELNKCTNWNEKLDVFLSHVPPTYTLLSVDNNKSVCTTIYERLIAVHKYDIAQLPKIESPIVLLKPTIQSLSFPQEDYGLHKITKGKIKVCYIEGNHITMLDNDKVVAAINGEHVESVKNLKLDLTDHDNVTSIKDTYTRS